MGSPVYSYSTAEHRQEPFVIVGEVIGGLVDGVWYSLGHLVQDRELEGNDGSQERKRR